MRKVLAHSPDLCPMGIDPRNCVPSTKDLTDRTSFKSVLITPVLLNTDSPDTDMDDSTDDTIEAPHAVDSRTSINIDTEDLVLLSAAEKERIYRPWCYSVIIKLLGKNISHEYLKRKLSLLWRPTEEIILIDLGHDYYIVKFLKEENMITAAQGGQ